DGSTVNGWGGESRQVPVKTIDAIVSERNLTGNFLLKFDTHGYELPILKGARQTLNKTSIIIMEAYNFQISDNALRFHEMCANMESLGFRCYDIADPMLRDYDKSFWQMDLFFCRNDEKIFKYPHYK
ncbi:MAG: FkbM family methyltransferase, partial [Proteobacteria bacterium]|nr:FkbM family methyltransferase [Pseudomonadota bacterium]